METTFEHFGWYKEYYINNVFLGTNVIEDPMDQEIGYKGRKEEVLNEDIKIGRKVIKAGTKVRTIVYPLCGKIIKK